MKHSKSTQRTLSAIKSEVIIVVLIALLIFAWDVFAQNDIRYIHQEKSLYRNILVTEDSNRRCLRFTITSRIGQNQSCRFLEDPVELVFPYAKMTLSSLLVQDNPERILIVGLGGGTLPDTYQLLFPDVEIVVSEIDDAVFRVARDYFDFEETDKIKVNIGDARVFVKRAGIRNEKYDLVILDAFNGEYIPEHLMTVEFLEEVKALLTEDGMALLPLVIVVLLRFAGRLPEWLFHLYLSTFVLCALNLKLAKLCQKNHDRKTVHKAQHHRMRHKANKPAPMHHPDKKLYQPHQNDRCKQVFNAVLRHKADHHNRQRPRGTRNHPRTATDQRCDQPDNKRRIQPDQRMHTGDKGKGDSLRNQCQGDGQT